MTNYWKIRGLASLAAAMLVFGPLVASSTAPMARAAEAAQTDAGTGAYEIAPMDLHKRLIRECRIAHAGPAKLFAPFDGLVSAEVAEGMFVEAGEVLARYEAAQAERDLREARSRLETLRLRRERIDGALREAKLRLMALEAASIDREIATAEESLALAERLAEEGKLSRDRLGDSTEALARLRDDRSAVAERRAVFEIENALQVADLDHEILRIGLAVEELQDRLARSVLRSPDRGIVSALGPRLAEAAAVPVRAGAHLFTIADPSRLGATVPLTGDEADTLRGAEVTVTAGSDRRAEARLVRLDRNEDAPDWQAEDHVAVIAFEDPEREWQVGRDASCVFSKTAVQDALAVPVRAVQRIDGATYVSRLTGAGNGGADKAEADAAPAVELVPVETGIADPPFIQILSGLSLGDRIAIE